MSSYLYFRRGLPTEQRTCIKYIRELSQFLRIKGESRNGWPKAVLLLEIFTCPRSRMNRLNDVTVSRISVRLGCTVVTLRGALLKMYFFNCSHLCIIHVQLAAILFCVWPI